MKIAHIDNNRQILGWYDTEIHNSIPKPNIEVTEKQWQLALDNGHNKINNDGTTEVVDFRTTEDIKEQNKATQIAEAKEYLASTDFYFTIDKYATLSEERKLELNTLRVEARVLINSLEEG